MQLTGVRSLPLVLACAVCSCGGQVGQSSGVQQDAGLDSSGATDSAADGAADTSTDAPPDDPCAPAGVRVCGAGCPPLDAAQCPGLGCVAALDTTSSTATGVGLCLGDLPAPIRPCGRCADGEVCVDLEGQGFVCAAETLCARLFAMGAGAACRYADFSPYDGRPLAVASGDACPKANCGYPDCEALSCGPGCGQCGGFRICTGRSADVGYGLCADEPFSAPPCRATDPPTASCQRCLAWAPPSPWDSAAQDYGWCAVPVECDTMVATGRVRCEP